MKRLLLAFGYVLLVFLGFVVGYGLIALILTHVWAGPVVTILVIFWIAWLFSGLD